MFVFPSIPISVTTLIKPRYLLWENQPAVIGAVAAVIVVRVSVQDVHLADLCILSR